MSGLVVLASTFTAGFASSVGPCIAPRYLMLAAYATQRRDATKAAVFVMGCLGGYLVYACAGALIAFMRVGTHFVYAFFAVALVVAGLRALTTSFPHSCASAGQASFSLGGAFLAGVLSSMTFSPCCAPIAFGLGLVAAQHDLTITASLLLAFGLGHTLPLVVIAAAASTRRLERFRLPQDVGATISGSLFLMVGGLYAILA